MKTLTTASRPCGTKQMIHSKLLKHHEKFKPQT
jgi:hypothetical protein